MRGIVVTTTRTRQRSSRGRADQADADTRTCEHGQRIKRAGVGQKSGKPYAGYFCPKPQPGACEPIWATDKVIADALAAWAADDEAAKPSRPAVKEAENSATSAVDIPPF
jgi:hypothetical protein